MSRIGSMFRLLLDLLRQEGGWSRVWVGLGMAITMAGGGLIYYQTQQPAEGTANLWVDTNGGTCTRNSSPAAYSDAAACSSLAAAHTAASAGDLVLVKGGTYGAQTLTADKGSPHVVFQEASGETVDIDQNTGSFDITSDLKVSPGAGNVTFKDMHAEAFYADDCTGAKTSVTLVNMDLEYINLQRAIDFSFIGGDIGPTHADAVNDAHPLVNDCGGATSNLNRGLLFDGVLFHDATTDGPSFHTECLLVTGADGDGSMGSGMTIRDSTFSNCDSTGAFFITRWNNCGNELNDVLLENNFFLLDNTGDFQPSWLQMENNVNGFYFINNTWARAAVDFDSSSNNGCGYPEYSIHFYSNYGKLGIENIGTNPCTGDGNVWVTYVVTSDVCTGEGSPHGGSLEVVDEETDLHLAGGSFAIDNGDATQNASTDIDGETRPLGSGFDAGADEKE